MELSNGALVHFPTQSAAPADLELSPTKSRPLGLMSTGSLDSIDAKGGSGTLRRLLTLTDQLDPNFPIVTP